MLVLAKKSYPQATGVLPYLADGDGPCPELSVLTNLAVAILDVASIGKQYESLAVPILIKI